MKPYIISHMMMSVDGRIDCDMTEKIDDSSAYYDALDALGCPSQLMGRVTMQMHYAPDGRFVAADKTPAGHEACHVAVRAGGYMMVLDTHGTLVYPETEVEGLPLVVVTTEDCPKAFHERLSAQGISWMAVGKEQIDLYRAMELARERFGIERLALVGGGHVNGAFLAAGLLDEVSVMVGPGIDGRKGMTAVFDGIERPDAAPVRLRLESVERVGDGTVWLRYKV